MPYNITKSDGTPYSVADLAIDSKYTISLLGRDAPNFGLIEAQDALRRLENFSNDTPPRGAIKGQLWFNNSNNSLMQYQGADPSGPSDTSSTSTTNWHLVGADFSSIGSSLSPSADQLYDLGSSVKRFHKVYGMHGIFNTSGDTNTDGALTGIALQATGNVSVTSGSVYPTGSGQNLGKTSNYWDTSFVQTSNVSGNLVLGVSPNVAGIVADTTTVGTILPVGTVSLGKSTNRFNAIFSNSVNSTALSVGANGIGSSLVPSSNIAYDLGSGAKQFNNVYAQNIVENGTALSSKYVAAGQSNTIFNGDITLLGHISSPTHRLIIKDSATNSYSYYDMVTDTSRTVGSYLGGSEKVLLATDLNTGDSTFYRNIIVSALFLKNPSNTTESVATIALDNKLYMGSTARPFVLQGGQQTLTYDYGSGNKIVWHSGQMGSGSGLDADMVDGQHLSDLDNRFVNISGDNMTGTLSAPVIGIGTTSPVRQLHVSSSDLYPVRITSSNTSATVFEIQNTAAGKTWEMSVAAPSNLISVPSGGFYIFDQSAGVRMSIDPSGNMLGAGNITATQSLVAQNNALVYGTLVMNLFGSPGPIINVANPTNPQDAATKFYVDNFVQTSNSSKVGYIGGFHQTGTFVYPAGGTYFTYYLYFNGSGACLNGAAGNVGGGTSLAFGSNTGFGWYIKIA